MNQITLLNETKEIRAKILSIGMTESVLDDVMKKIESEKELMESGNDDMVYNKNQYESTVKKILQKLDYFYLTFTLDNIDSLQDLLLSSIRHIHYKSHDSNVLSFAKLQSVEEDMEIGLLYETLKMNSVSLANKLLEEWDGVEESIETDIDYILPLAVNKNCVCSMSITEFLRFVQTCFKYDELADIVDALLKTENETIDDLIYISNDLIKGDELFLLEPIDEIVKGDISDTGKLSTVVETNMDDIMDDFDLPKQIDLHTVSSVSIVTFKHLLNSEIRNKVMMENIYKTLEDSNDIDINIALPQPLILSEYCTTDINDIVDLSIGLMNLINERTGNIRDMLLVQLGSFMKYFRYSNNVYKDSKFVMENITNHNKSELAAMLNERLETLKNTKVGKYYIKSE